MRKRLICLMVGMLLLPASFALGDWDPGMPAKWIQMPDLDLTGIDINASPSIDNYILADDFECTETGALTEIHLFGSWLNDSMPINGPGQIMFTLSIHADIPADQSGTGYSMPGEILWYRDIQAGDFMVRPYAEGINEGWMDPPEEYIFPGDTVCWQYNITIPEEEAFIQEGTADTPVTYWLDVKAMPADGQSLFGWKTAVDHWNDDAVWGSGEEPFMGPWEELLYPQGHEFAGQSIDLAFVLNGVPISGELDFGDAPDTYQTLLASNGPRHQLGPLYLGAQIDGEPDGQPTGNAMGDDLAGIDDEDGVTFTSPLKPAQPATVDVTASQPGLLDAWIDFDGNGFFHDPGEQIFASLPLAAGLNSLTFNVPAAIAENTSTASRFRISTLGGLAYSGVYPDGTIPDGEVEDHEVFLSDRYTFKWIQQPDLSTQGIDVCATKTVTNSNGFILADDFPCTATGPVTDIHIWGSWVDDRLPFNDPRQVVFTLSIHADIPATATEFSRPGELLWKHTFDPESFQVEEFAGDIEEGWMYPPGDYHFPGDWTCWQYDFHVDPHMAFLQEGTETDPVVYWLDVQAEPLESGTEFGWKTATDHWNDDAVWGWGVDPYSGQWDELIYPNGHQLEGVSIDLAFALLEDSVTPVTGEVPRKTGLLGNTPNPFNPSTVIRYVMPAGGGDARLQVFDPSGRLVKTLVNGFVAGGPQSVEWNGRDDDGREMPSGVYFYRLDGPAGTEALKMLLLR